MTSEQAKSLSVREVMGEEIYATIQPYIEKALRGQSASFEGHLSFKKAGRRYVQIDFVPRRDQGREVYGFEGCSRIARDVHDTLAQGFTGLPWPGRESRYARR